MAEIVEFLKTSCGLLSAVLPFIRNILFLAPFRPVRFPFIPLSPSWNPFAMLLEATPLIEETSASTNYGTNDGSETVVEEETKNESSKFFTRLAWLCVLGIGALIVAELTFLPRTSPNRDFRRWHGLKHTKSDIERLFVSIVRPGGVDSDGFTIENRILEQLKNLSRLNEEKPYAIAGSASSKLFEYVKEKMAVGNFATRVFSYDLPSSLLLPLSLNLTLYDAESSRELYNTKLDELHLLTPAFYVFSRSGSVRKAYVNANKGNPDDFQLLLENEIVLHDRIVLFSHSSNSSYSLEDKIALAESFGCAGVVVYGTDKSSHSISRNFKPSTIPASRFRIPASYSEIKPILVALGPPIGDFESWRHAPFSEYSLELELNSVSDNGPLCAQNIVATMPSALHDGVIVVGSSRDSLTQCNPLSGHAIMLEMMNQLQKLQTLGWLPLRTIKFVSWDSSRSLALGSLSLLRDHDFLTYNGPIIAYVNLDLDVVTGSHFTVDCSPLLNHIMRHAALFVPFDRPDIGRSILEEEESRAVNRSLLSYWKSQDNCTINNKLGYLFQGKDVGNFQLNNYTPSINIKFEQSQNGNDLGYKPESNYYSLDWVREMDQGLQLHGSLLRFVGLLVISLGESEVVDMKVRPFFESLKTFYSEIMIKYAREIHGWIEEDVTSLVQRIPNYALLHDSNQFTKKDSKQFTKKDSKYRKNETVTFNMILQTYKVLINELVSKAEALDQYAMEMEDLWTLDLPWFQFAKKLAIVSKFSRLNRKLIHLEESFSSLKVAGLVSPHLLYDGPHGILPIKDKMERGALASWYQAFDNKSLDQVVYVMAQKYERLKGALASLS